MDTKKFALATLAGTVTYFLLGYIIYEPILGNFFASNTGSAMGVPKTDNMVWWALILGNLGWAALLTFIFMYWASISTLASGAKAGAIIGGLMALGFDFVTYATSNVMNLTATIVDVIVFAIMSAIVGGVIGLTLGNGSK